MVAILVPLGFFLVTGIIWVSYIYFRAKEKQVMIEKGLTPEQMYEFLKSKRNPSTILKLGVIIVFFGIGLGAGLLIEAYTYVDEWIPFLIITFIGIGFILAYFVGKKFDKE